MTDKNSILEKLNPKQEEAATYIEGPLLIIAGPGSGKTRTITHRIAYMINQGISPGRILAVTFTNKAAGEMEQRVEKLLQKTESEPVSPTVSTFHSFCAGLLRKEAEKLDLNSDFVIYDSKDSLSLVKKIMKDFEIDSETLKPKSIQKKINQAKNNLKDADDYARSAGGFPETEVAKVYREYQRQLEQNNACDFADLILKVVGLFSQHESVLEKYQQKYRYLMVDEYQDTNHAQYRLSYLLSRKYENIAVVGDDAQSVYGFRGADYRNILEFEEDWPDAKVVKLEQNYRSTQNVLDAANCIIKKNKDQKEKSLWTNKESGPEVTAKQVPDQKKEARFITRKIRSLKGKSNLGLSDFAVLFRTNAQSRALEERFMKEDYPYKLVGSVRFYERREIKDILAYLRIIHNPQDSISLERIYNVPRRGLGQKTFGKARSVLQKNLVRMKKGNLESEIEAEFLSTRAEKACNDFLELFSDIFAKKTQASLSDLIKYILERINYKDYIRDKTEQGQQRWENIKELLTVAEGYDNMDSDEALKEFLEKISLLSDQDQMEEDKELVNLMTLHSVKGLEFPCVFIVGCEEGLLPHSRSLLDKSEIAEERRLCYVGITRAEKWVYLVYAKKRRLYGRHVRNPRSRFIDDISDEFVEHSKF